MTSQLTYLEKEELLKATREHHSKFWISLGVETHITSQTNEVITGIHHPLLNYVLRTQFMEKDSSQFIQSVIDRFEKRNLPFSWWLEPIFTPLQFEKQLQEHGLIFLGVFPGMGLYLKDLEVSHLYPENFTVEKITSSGMMKEWGSVFQRGLKIPDDIIKQYIALYDKKGFSDDQPYKHFIGKMYNTAIASATLFIDDDSGGIYNLSVLPEFRGQGIATSMILNLLLMSQFYGCRISVLQSSEMMYNIYRRLGFQKLVEWHVYFSKGPMQISRTSVLPQKSI